MTLIFFIQFQKAIQQLIELMINSETSTRQQPPNCSGEAKSWKKQSKTKKYLEGDKTRICKDICFSDERTMKQVRNFLILRERGEAIILSEPQAYSTYLKIDAPFIDCASIIQHQNLPELIRHLIAKLILASNMNIYSIDNIIYDPCSGLVYLNNISIVGLIAIWKEGQFQFQELRQIFELLSEEVFDESSFSSKFSYKLKFQAIGMVILKHIFQKDISLLKPLFKQKPPEKIKFRQARQLCSKLPQLFRQILSNPAIRKKILDAQKRDQLSYGVFLQQVFLGPKHTKLRDRLDLNWKRVISLLITGASLSKEDSLNQQIEDLKTIFIECYNCLNAPTKKHLKSLGLESQDWQILFKLSIGEDALELDLQSYFRQASCTRLNRSIIEASIRGIVCTKGWISKALYQSFNVISNRLCSNQNSFQSITVKSQSSFAGIAQGNHKNIDSVGDKSDQDVVMNEKDQAYLQQSLSVQLDCEDTQLDYRKQCLPAQFRCGTDEINLSAGKDCNPKWSKQYDKSMGKSEYSSSKESSIQLRSRISQHSCYSLQAQSEFLERPILDKQIKILTNLAYKFRVMEIQMENSSIRAIDPKIKILNKYLRVMN